jgi:hypothetical protein
MDHPAYRIVGTLGTIVTATSVVDLSNGNIWINLALIVVAGYSAIFFALDTVRAMKKRPLSFDRASTKGKSAIAEHLVKHISSSGRVAILSRDLTWVAAGSEAESLLVKKAENRELTVFVKSETPITSMLRSHGADIRCYLPASFNPRSRFTILDYQNSGAHVMIGAPSGTKHVIKHYGIDDFEVVDLANDFMSVLEARSRKKRGT